MSIYKKCAPKLVFFNEKKIDKDSDDFCCRKLTESQNFAVLLVELQGPTPKIS